LDLEENIPHTQHACLAISDLVYEALEDDKVSIILSLDVAKAFDRVDRKILLHKLSWYGINSKLIESFLTNRRQFVNIVNETGSSNSQIEETELGVPQGSALSNYLISK